MTIVIAGIPLANEVATDLVKLCELAGLAETADRLRDAIRFGLSVLPLEIAAREQILRALGECPPAFAELRDVLLREHEARVELGLCRLSRALTNP